MYCTRHSAASHAAHVNRSALPAAHVSASTISSFYTHVLGGSEVSPADGATPDDALFFFVEGQLVEVHASRDGAPDVLDLTVDGPIDIAERCWDAGYTVRLEGDDAEAILYVTDPLGRSIALHGRA